MLISESGSSKQFELTKPRIAACVAVTLGLFVLAGFLFGAVGFLGHRSSSQEAVVPEKVKALEEDLRQKTLAVAVLEKRVKELADSPPPASASKSSVGTETDESPLTGFQQPAGKPVPFSKSGSGAESDSLHASLSEKPTQKNQAFGSAEPASSAPGELKNTVRPPVMNFDAQDVTALVKGPNSGTLSFKLVKDLHDIRFSGYLFVFVEMTDQRGENKIYVYPETARLGEEDLPSDFKDGEVMSFKINLRVKLPFEDIRPGANLSRISILLYSENGKIVFQRGFESKELKIVTVDGSQKPAERRRPL